jgi:peptide/nickel transport system substrate-binding protein
MTVLSRRRFLNAAAATAAATALPRVAIAQADDRPTITVAVQQISNSASLEVLREQSNVGERVFASIYEGLIARNLQGKLEPVPGLAESWKRIDEKTVELQLRQGVKFHNGDEMTADDVVFSYGPERMFGKEFDATSSKTLFTTVMTRDSVQGMTLPPEVPAVAKRSWPSLDRVEAVSKYTVRFVNRTPDVTLEGRLARYGSEIISRRGFLESKSWIEWARKPITTGHHHRPLQGARVPARPDADPGRA